MKIKDIDTQWLYESEHDNFKFKKIGVDRFKTFVEVRDKKYPVEVYKNGNRWIASYFNGALIKSADTKRFATLEIRNAMRRDRQFFESIDGIAQYDNWSKHGSETIEADFTEYKRKEDKKWKRRAEDMGFRFPIFDTKESYINGINSGNVVTVDDALWDDVVNLSKNSSIEDLKDLVQEYTVPRDVDRIVDGFENNVNMPYPVILKGANGMHIMSGNTRLNTARILGIRPKALVVDVTE